MTDTIAAHCSFCQLDVPDLFVHQELHFAQDEMEHVIAFMAGMSADRFHSRSLVIDLRDPCSVRVSG